MEALSLLKYWRNGALTKASASASANEASVVSQTDEEDQLNEDEGPFFDFEFAVPLDEEEGEEDDINDDPDSIAEEEEEEAEAEAEAEIDCTETDGEREFNFTIPLDPSDDHQPNSKSTHQFPVSIFKSATKFRVFMLGLKRQKPSTANPEKAINGSSPPPPTKQGNSKSFTVKFKVEEVPIVSLLTRENSSSGNKLNKKLHTSEEEAEEKRFAKDALLNKYLKMIKPLKRYGDKKFGFSGQLSSLGLMGNKNESTTPPTPTQIQTSPTMKLENSNNSKDTEAIGGNVKSPKQGNLQASLRVVCKHLGKSRSASSSAVAAAPTPTPPPFNSRRQDDSLLQQQDGIQSAILHCKKSLNNAVVPVHEQSVTQKIR